MQKENIRCAIEESLVDLLEFDAEKQWYESVEVNPLDEKRFYSFSRQQLVDLFLHMVSGDNIDITS